MATRFPVLYRQDPVRVGPSPRGISESRYRTHYTNSWSDSSTTELTTLNFWFLKRILKTNYIRGLNCILSKSKAMKTKHFHVLFNIYYLARYPVIRPAGYPAKSVSGTTLLDIFVAANCVLFANWESVKMYTLGRRQQFRSSL